MLMQSMKPLLLADKLRAFSIPSLLLLLTRAREKEVEICILLQSEDWCSRSSTFLQDGETGIKRR